MKNTAVMFAGIAVMIACQQEVELPQLPYTPKIVIQGILEPDSVPVVHLNHTVPYLSGTTDPAQLVVRNARVVISSGDVEDHLALDSVFLPLDCRFAYFYRGASIIKRNKLYELSINADGRTYTASASTFLTPVTIDKVSYTPAFKDLYGEHEGVITWFHDIPGEDNFYRFEMTRKVDRSTRDVTGNGRDLLVPCLEEGDTILFTEIGRSVYSDNNLQGEQIRLIIEPALTHLVPVTIHVRIQTIDRAMYEFYDQIDGQKLAQYNPFVEPVFLRSNQFGKDAIGFFGAMVRSDPVTFEMPRDD